MERIAKLSIILLLFLISCEYYEFQHKHYQVFGSSVSQNDQYLAIGAPVSEIVTGEWIKGRIYLYEKNNESWKLKQTIQGENKSFGSMVHLRPDNQLIISTLEEAVIYSPDVMGNWSYSSVFNSPGYTYLIADQNYLMGVYRYDDDDPEMRTKDYLDIFKQNEEGNYTKVQTITSDIVSDPYVLPFFGGFYADIQSPYLITLDSRMVEFIGSYPYYYEGFTKIFKKDETDEWMEIQEIQTNEFSGIPFKCIIEYPYVIIASLAENDDKGAYYSLKIYRFQSGDQLQLLDHLVFDELYGYGFDFVFNGIDLIVKTSFATNDSQTEWIGVLYFYQNNGADQWIKTDQLTMKDADHDNNIISLIWTDRKILPKGLALTQNLLTFASYEYETSSSSIYPGEVYYAKVHLYQKQEDGVWNPVQTLYYPAD